MLQRKFVSKSELTAALEEVLEYLECQSLDPAPGVLELVPVALAKKSRAIPVDSDGKTLLVVMAEPQIDI